VCSTEMMAGVAVEPAGRKANWSVNCRSGEGDSNAGYRQDYCRTTNSSITRVRTGVMEMGRKTASCLGAGTFLDRSDAGLLPLIWNRRRTKRS